MSKNFFAVILTALVGIALLAPAPVVAGPGLNNTDDPTAEYGVAVLEINGATIQAASLGGVEVDTSGTLVYLAVNNVGGGAGDSRMIQFPIPDFIADLNFDDSLDPSGNIGNLVDATATSNVGGEDFLINSDLTMALPDNPNDHSGDYILGMTMDSGNNALYAAVQDGGGGTAIMRFDPAGAITGSVIEFAEPNIPTALSPNFSPVFTDVMMGAESVAFFRQPSATDLFFYPDGTSSDFVLNWAVQDLEHQRQDTGVLHEVENLVGADNDEFTDEMRVHRSIVAGARAFVAADPYIYSDIVLVPIAQRMAVVSGREFDNGVFLINDLNDNTEPVLTDSDAADLVTVLPGRIPTALCNVFNVGEFSRDRMIIVADYDPFSDTTALVRAEFNGAGNVIDEVELDLSTPDNVLPGRITGLASDADGNIYAVDGKSGCVFLVTLNEDLSAPPEPDPNFACFETDFLTLGSAAAAGRFTPASLVDFANNVRGATDVITRLDLVTNGDLDLFLPNGATDIRKFYYVNRPITITELDRMLVTNGDWLIFRGDGAERAYVEVNGRLITDASKPFDLRMTHDPDDLDEATIRYTSVIGFVSWLKSLGITSYADLNWAAPAGNAAALEFEEFLTREISPGVDVFDAVHDGGVPAAEEDRLEEIVNDIHADKYGNDVGRWGGLYFVNPDVGTGRTTTSNIEFSKIELAEVGIYCQDDDLDPFLTRDEDALRIVRNTIQSNLIGLSIDGFSPLVALNTITSSSFEGNFDNRSFGGSSPFNSACSINRTTQRFPVGNSGTGVFITKRVPSFDVEASPMFYGNSIVGNFGNGVQVQQPGVGGFPGSRAGRQPRPLFGSLIPPGKMAHEFANRGNNNIFGNGGDPSEPTFRNFVYNVEEIPTDSGAASVDHDGDLEAPMNYWGSGILADVLMDIRDGRTDALFGEIILDQFIGSEFLSSVENSTELYE